MEENFGKKNSEVGKLDPSPQASEISSFAAEAAQGNFQNRPPTEPSGVFPGETKQSQFPTEKVTPPDTRPKAAREKFEVLSTPDPPTAKGSVGNVTRLLSVRQVLERVPIARSTLYLWIAQGLFPTPVKFGPRRVGWPEDRIEDWLISHKPTSTSEET